MYMHHTLFPLHTITHCSVVIHDDTPLYSVKEASCLRNYTKLILIVIVAFQRFAILKTPFMYYYYVL